jgi:hypothetical protein
LRGEAFTVGIIGVDRDPFPVPYPLVIVDHVVAGIRQLDLLGPKRAGDLGPMLQEATPLSDMGWVGGGTHR